MTKSGLFFGCCWSSAHLINTNIECIYSGVIFFPGFGSFVEKTVMPYISTTPAKLLNPCTSDQNCTSPFSYKNVLSLTEDGRQFNSLVSRQQISGNLDSPEGGFDAIMQVAVCGVSLLGRLLELKSNSIGLFPVVMPCVHRINAHFKLIHGKQLYAQCVSTR